MGLHRLSYLLLVALILAFGAGVAAAQQQTVVLERDAALLAAPQNGAAVVAQLTQGATGEVLVRKGAWVNVKTDAGTGWLYSFNVRFVAPGATGSAVAAPPSRSASAPRPRGTITATIGIRGLGEEDLRQARYDAAQVRLLDEYASSRQDAAETARASGLTAERVEYFK